MKYTDPSGYSSQPVEELEVTPPDEGCNEVCQRKGYNTWFYTHAEAINTSNARWEAWGGQFFNVASVHGELALAMAQGISLSQSTIKPGGGSKTNTNNVLGTLADTASLSIGFGDENGNLSIHGQTFAMGIAPDPTLVRAAATKAVMHMHHAWPKYLGGPVKQKLVSLERELHQKFHIGLDKILPRQKGTEYYKKIMESKRQEIFKDFSSYTKAFDAKYGTNLYEMAVKNGFPRM